MRHAKAESCRGSDEVQDEAVYAHCDGDREHGMGYLRHYAGRDLYRLSHSVVSYEYQESPTPLLSWDMQCSSPSCPLFVPHVNTSSAV